jgi:membrane protein DedA with SNARE-associated domain
MSLREPLAAFFSVPSSIDYPLLFALMASESAGALVPGETALILAGALAGRGQLSLPLVIVTAAVAAILGDNVGDVIGRKGLRRLLDRPGWLAAKRRHAVARGEELFDRHGPAAVFVGLWLPGLRVVVAWLAGAERLAWRRFLPWNALGGIAWAASIAGVAYLLGKSSSAYLGLIGFGGLAISALVLAIRRLWHPALSAALPAAGRAIVAGAALILVAVVVAALGLGELRREAANAVAQPKRHE